MLKKHSTLSVKESTRRDIKHDDKLVKKQNGVKSFAYVATENKILGFTKFYITEQGIATIVNNEIVMIPLSTRSKEFAIEILKIVKSKLK